MVENACSFNLLTDPFFPVLTVSGEVKWLTFLELQQEEGDYPVSFCWRRGDLDIASFEFVVGVLSLVYQLQDRSDWVDLWRGRHPTDLARRIASIAHAFNLTGDAAGKGPRFMQEFDPIDGEANRIEALFIDTPGINGQKKNADLLTHRDRFPALGARAAAMALYALQQFAPSGGAGNRTSLRGGGPMTTLLLPDRPHPPTPLWRTVLANLPLADAHGGYLDDAGLSRALPWLAPTLTSDGKPALELSQPDPRVHPLQAFFGMPRRIRLVEGGHGICSLTGEEGPVFTGFIQKPWGTNLGAWRHPLTPYRQAKETETPYTVKPKSGRFGYREWVGVVISRSTGKGAVMPAMPVAAFVSRAHELRRQGFGILRLKAAGWAMNNMEAGTFMQSVQPLYVAEDPALQDQFSEFAVALASAGDEAANLLRRNLKLALFGERSKTATEGGVFDEATNAFFERTEDAFHDALAAAIDDPVADDQQRRKHWLGLLRTTAIALFDMHTKVLLGRGVDMKVAGRVTDAYRFLRGALGETGKVAVALGIDQPVGKISSRRSRKVEGEANP